MKIEWLSEMKELRMRKKMQKLAYLKEDIPVPKISRKFQRTKSCSAGVKVSYCSII